jgi:hypothetical protein
MKYRALLEQRATLGEAMALAAEQHAALPPAAAG